MYLEPQGQLEACPPHRVADHVALLQEAERQDAGEGVDLAAAVCGGREGEAMEITEMAVVVNWGSFERGLGLLQRGLGVDIRQI